MPIAQIEMFHGVDKGTAREKTVTRQTCRNKINIILLTHLLFAKKAGEELGDRHAHVGET
jgi:hypothetical protein